MNKHGAFIIENYFAHRYGVAPSEMMATAALPESMDTYRTILGELSISTNDPGILRRNWEIVDRKEKPEGESFPDALSYASDVEALCITIQLYDQHANVNFYYDANDQELETRLLKLAEYMENTYVADDVPEFEVLTVNNGSFGTTSIEIKPMKFDLATNYNDDFLAVDDIIRASIKEERSGLILLHGLPGTGKTSYIKNLITTNPKQRLIFIPNDFVQNMLQPGFINFLLTKKDSIIVIEDAEKVIMSRTDSGQNSVVSTILQITDGLFSDFLNIKIICTFNTDISRIDKALFRKGRMIAFYEFGELTEDKARALVGPDVALPGQLTLAELFNTDVDNFQEEARETRRIGFA